MVGVLFWFCYSFFYKFKLFKQDYKELNKGTDLPDCYLCQKIKRLEIFLLSSLMLIYSGHWAG